MIAYIPARGGSKRIPRKNIRLLGGKPVLVHVLDALRSLRFIEAVCVSSDDEEVLGVAHDAGAITLEPRSPLLSDDYTTFMALLQQDVPRFIHHFGTPAATAELLWVLSTAALVPASVYESAHDEFRRSGSDLLVSTTSFENSPYRALIPADGGRWRPLFPDKLMTRSQDLPETRVDCGLFYYMRYAAMRAVEGHWFNAGGGPATYSVPEWMAIDVDTPDDWDRLERSFAAHSRA